MQNQRREERAERRERGEPRGTASSTEQRQKFEYRQVITALMGLPRVFRLIWSISRGFTGLMISITVVQAALPALNLWTTKNVIDSVVAAIQINGSEAAVALVMQWVALQFGLAVLGSILGNVNSVVQTLLRERVRISVNVMLLEHASRLDLAAYEQAEFYNKMQQVRNEASWRSYSILEQTFGLMRSLMTLLAMVGIILTLNPLLALIAFVLPIPGFFTNVRFGWMNFRMNTRTMPERRRSDYMSNVLTNDTLIKEVQLYGLGGYFLQRYYTLSNSVYQQVRRLVLTRSAVEMAMGLIPAIATSGIYLYVAFQAIAQRITLGDLTLYTQATSQAQGLVTGVLGTLANMYEMNLFVNTLFEFLELRPSITKPDQPKPVPAQLTQGIAFEHVWFAYPGGEPVLRDVSFEIRAGESVALVGANGAGKTTIVKLLSRLYDPTEGRILLDGQDLRDYDPAAVRERIAVVFQDYARFQLKAYENIGLGEVEQIENQSLIEQAAERGGAAELIADLPSGYDQQLGKQFDGGMDLSGGQWQKVALARAFMRDSQLIILDEPTAALDPRAEFEVYQRFHELVAGRAALLISHRFSTVRMADRIIVLEYGQIIEQGNHDELMHLNGRYAELYRMQADRYK